MKKIIALILFSILQLSFIGSAQAGKRYIMTGGSPALQNAYLEDLSCSTVKTVLSQQQEYVMRYWVDSNCGLIPTVADLANPASLATGVNAPFVAGKYGTEEDDILFQADGFCQAGVIAGDVSLPWKYVKITDTSNVIKMITDLEHYQASVAGCKVKYKPDSARGCFVDNGAANADGIGVCVTTITLIETGEDGTSMGSADDLDATAPPYEASMGTGGTGTTGPGGSTGTGTGGTGTGTGGTGTGTGGTGTGGTGGTGTGGTGTSAGDANCGAPGQPTCSINETGTPTGPGTLFDDLMALVTGIGDDRQHGLDNAVASEDKDTTLGISISQLVPSAGSCENPSFELPILNVTKTVDICQWLPYVSAMADLLWVGFFIFSVMSLTASVMSISKA
jgi:hypothetical protein